MSNSYFQFKQFRIEQGKSGMKVTTDGCLFGAMIDCKGAKRILDIGAGTGLLSLMLAQREAHAEITAIEIDQNAYEEASENFENAPWSNHLHIEHTSLQSFDSESQFDLIVSNPPFFKNNYKGNSSHKNKAIHNDTLPFSELAENAASLLTESGKLWVMYPEYEMSLFSKEAKNYGLHSELEIQVFNQQGKAIFRSIKQFSKSVQKELNMEKVIIKNQDGSYTDQFTSLLRDYYLHL